MENKLRWYERVEIYFVAIYLCCRYGIKSVDKIVTNALNEVEKEYELLKERKERGLNDISKKV